MKTVWLFAFALLLSSVAFAQREVDDNAGWGLKDRLYFGGGFGLNGGNDSFGNRYFYVGLNPIVGYMITPQLSSGLGLQWQHYSYPDFNTKIDQYGVSPFVRYNFGQLFAYMEYNVLNTPTFSNTERRNFDRFLMGLGYSQPLGRRGSLNAMALYDVIYSNAERAFASPWVFRVYFSL
ncbi:MAG: hypothetical protein RH948_07535 [Cyclobacteriaceae bacterium]